MKKILVLISTFLLFTALTACSGDNQAGGEQLEENGNYVENVAVSSENDIHETGETTISPYEQIRLDVLADFDFLVEELEANMPLYGVLYRRLGIDFAVLLAGVRERILTEDIFDGTLEDVEQMERAAADFLFAALQRMSIPLGGIGHLAPFSYDMYLGYLVYLKRLQTESPEEFSPIMQSWLEVFAHPAALWFYGVDMDELDLDDEGVSMLGADRNAIRTSIISPREIALVSIRHAMNTLDFDRETLYPFFEEIQNYEHLIIDLSEHSGGYTIHFRELILSPLLSVPVQVEGHEFFMDGDRTQRYLELLLLQYDEAGNKAHVHDAVEFVTARNMMYFNQYDLETLAWVFEYSYMIEPIKDGFPFGGRIWILTGERTASAGELAILQASSTGFATTVGAPTQGIMPAESSYILLPNTGIIFRMDLSYFTDTDGRSLEEFGITPDYPNHPNRTAFQTVLEMIESGYY